MRPNPGDFLLEIGQLPEDCVTALTSSFNALPPNPYPDGAFRLRRYSHFRFDGQQPERLPTKTFVQDEAINRFHGNVERTYPEIEDPVVSSDAFAEMFRRFRAMTGIESGLPIEVHQMRILAGHEAATEVAPEGVHQDGFRHLGVFVIERRNVCGGEIQVHTRRDARPFVSHAFDQGEFVVLNDQRFWHSAAAMEAANDDEAYMDLFVLTA